MMCLPRKGCFADSLRQLERKIMAVVTLALAMFGVLPLSAGDISDLQGLVMKEIKFPVYRGDKLQLFIYGGRAVKNGQLVAVEYPVLDIIRKGADINNANFDRSVRPYPLEADVPALLDFWRRKLYCDGAVFSDTADVNYQTKEVVGKDVIKLRTPLLDMDGKGFRAEYEKRRMEVFSNIKFILRFNVGDPVKLLQEGKTPDKYSFLRGSGDRLFIDFDAGTITLTGHVRVTEEQNVLTCDQLTVYLSRGDDNDSKKQSPGGKSSEFALENSEYGSGIREIVCTGNVVLDRKGGKTLQQGRADKLIYSFADNMIRLRGEKNNPRIINGEDYLSAREIDLDRVKEKMFLQDNCLLSISASSGEKAGNLPPSRITSKRAEFDLRSGKGVFDGDVRVDDPRMSVSCRKLEVDTASTGTGEKKKSSGTGEGIGGLAELEDFSAAPRELKEIVCTGDVRIVRKNPSGSEYADHYATAEKATLDYPRGIAILSGGRPAVHYSGNSISGRELHVFINEERLKVPSESVVTLSNMRELPEAEKLKRKTLPDSTVKSDSCDLDYRNNLLTFTGNVQMRDPRLNMDCDLAEIFLKSTGKAENVSGKKDDKKSPLPAAMIAGSEENITSDKTVDKIICSGNVYAWEPRAKLYGDKLTMFFRTPEAGEKLSENAFASHGTELERIEVDDNVKLVSVPEKSTDRSDGAKEEKSSPETPDRSLTGMAGKLFAGGENGESTLTADKAELYLIKNEAHFHNNVKMFDRIHTLDAGNLYLYADNSARVRQRTEVQDIDADPFAGKGDVPGMVELGNQRALSRIVADTDVKFERKTEENTIQRAVGDKAVYLVTDKVLTVTGTPEKLPYLEETGKGRSTGERIVYYPERGEMITEGGTKIEFDPKLFK